MNKLIFVVMLAGLTGCLTESEVTVYRWPVDFCSDVQLARKTEKPVYGTVRLMQIGVRSPFDVESLSVLRADGTIASDPQNEFAATPAMLLRGLIYDSMIDSGRFADVVSTSSLTRSTHAAEVTVTRLCLDCRQDGVRRADCEVRFRLLKDREVVKIVHGSGAIDASDGDYGKAFSKAVSAAMGSALENL